MSLIHFIILRLLPSVMMLFVSIVFAMPLNASAQSCDSFHNCVSNNNVMSVKMFIADGQNVNAKDSQGRTALGIAINDNRTNIATILLTAGADVNLSGFAGNTPLHYAASRGNVTIASILLSANANVNVTDDSNSTPLHNSAHGNFTIVSMLLSKRASVNVTNNLGGTPLHLAARGGNADIVSILISAFADIEARTRGSETPLFRAATHGHFEAVSVLISAGANVNSRTSTGSTPINQATSRGYADIVKILLDAGATPITALNCNIVNQFYVNKTCQPCPQWINRDENQCRFTQLQCNDNDQVLIGDTCHSCPSHMPIRNGNMCEAVPASGGDGSGGSAGLYIGLGVVALAGLYLFTGDDIIGTYNFSSTYHYELNDNGYSYRAGLQGNYVTDNWHLHYAVDGNDSDDELRYLTGLAYSSNLWNAAFNEEIKGDNVDYDFSLSTKISGVNWEFSPTYALYSRHKNLSTNWQSETNNSLNLLGILYNGNWVVRSYASTEWQHFGEFGDSAKFNLLATWQF